MNNRVPRRRFLRLAPAGAATMAYAAQRSAKKLTARDIEISSTSYTVRDYPIRPKRHAGVTMKDTFWKPKIDINATVTIPFEIEKRAGSSSRRGLGGGVLEAAILTMESHKDARLEAHAAEAVRSLKDSTAGGNRGFEIAASYFEATGKRDLLDPAIKSAGALYEDFQRRKPPFSGGERDAINCVRLYQVTREKKHLDLAKHYLDIRGLEDSVNRSRHNQSHKPVLDQSEAVGHAVNCASLMVSLADVGVMTGIKDYLDAAQRMWQDAVNTKLYITGGVGSTGNEGFGERYTLPNISAYAETCAVLMFITLNHKLFLATGDSKYIDVMERGMYNNAIDGVSAAGNHFFYVNRLASAGDGRDMRWQRASLECCPPNMVRFLALMPGFIYAQDKSDAIYVNLYVSSEAGFKVRGRDVSLDVSSEMPWGGKSIITIGAGDGFQGSIRLRVPGWARNQPAPGGLYSYVDRLDKQTKVSINGNAIQAGIDRFGYINLDRTWRGGDAIEIEFPMEVRRVAADRRVKANRRRMAVERGPIVYCAEWPEVSGGQVLGLLFDSQKKLEPVFDPKLFGGVTVIETKAMNISNPSAGEKPVRLIPYYLWANRGAGEMSVWLTKESYAPGDIGPAGGLIFHENPNYQSDGWRYLEAAPFDQSSGAKWGCFRRLIAGARGTAVGTGKANTKDMLEGCADPGSAARLCADLSVNGVRGWFLPSRDELALMYRNLKASGAGDFGEAGAADNMCYWTSSQQTGDMAGHIDFADLGRVHFDDKDFPRRVRAIRAF